MASTRDYIPEKDEDFFGFQKKLITETTTNKVAWDVPDAALTALTAIQTTYQPLYFAVRDTGTRTKAAVVAHRESRQTFESALRSFVKAYLAGNPLVSDAQRAEMGLTVADHTPTPRGKIREIPIVGLQGLGGGDIEARCRATTDQTRSSIHPLADGIECRFVLAETGDVAPVDPDGNSMKSQISPKAKFIIPAGAKNAGQRFYGFFRWVNLSNPANSGEWGQVMTIIVS